jgi:hypothetical protein
VSVTEDAEEVNIGNKVASTGEISWVPFSYRKIKKWRVMGIGN